jgi:Zn finger protein HypA/HybF involved in hydrogenase expression
MKKSMVKEEYIKKSNITHSNKYDYSLIEYENQRSILNIVCKEHGNFYQIAYSHLSGIGCPKCGGSKRKTTEEFINESNDVHNNKYIYSLTIYKSSHKKVKIICPDHGEFEQTPNSHIRGNKCPKCELDMSKGELKITEYLKNKNIIFIPQHTFVDCKNIRCLPFDFFLPIYNICIEFDGIQHFRASKSWGGEPELEIRKIRDQIKTDFCENNSIKLIRIKYNENILDKLNSHLHF